MKGGKYALPKISTGEVKRYGEAQGLSNMQAYRELVEIRKEGLRLRILDDLKQATSIKEIKPILEAVLRGLV